MNYDNETHWFIVNFQAWQFTLAGQLPGLTFGKIQICWTHNHTQSFSVNDFIQWFHLMTSIRNILIGRSIAMLIGWNILPNRNILIGRNILITIGTIWNIEETDSRSGCESTSLADTSWFFLDHCQESRKISKQVHFTYKISKRVHFTNGTAHTGWQESRRFSIIRPGCAESLRKHLGFKLNPCKYDLRLIGRIISIALLLHALSAGRMIYHASF